MAIQKSKTVYTCSECGSSYPKWAGKCANCGEWNTLNEEVSVKTQSGYVTSSTMYSAKITPLNSYFSDKSEIRISTGTGELDRVLGGGLVKGSLILISGEPGVGKSTLLLQISGKIAESQKILYVSGEESAKQVKLRAERMSVTDPKNNFSLCSETDIGSILAAAEKEPPDVMIIDSIQTMFISEISSAPASITQVRECASALLKFAKKKDCSVFIVGHVNKDGGIAGPKVLEHVVDAVLYFEGERNSSYRVLRAEKNRFGNTNEIGVFEMTDIGLRELPNPSEALLAGRPKGVSGICVFPALEGSRCILTEIQALAAKNPYGGTPSRTADGFDRNRLSLLLAVIEKRTGFIFAGCDVFLNIIGGLKIDEPAADLGVAVALFSALCDKPTGEKTAVFGEIGLGGEIRAVSHQNRRAEEALRMGFTRIIAPKTTDNLNKIKNNKIIFVENLTEAFMSISQK